MIKSIESKSQRRYWQSTSKLFKRWMLMTREDIWDIGARETVIWEQPRKWSGKRSLQHVTWSNAILSHQSWQRSCSQAKVWGFSASQRHSLSGLKVNWTTWNDCASQPTRALSTCYGQQQVLSLSSQKHMQVRNAHCPWQYWHRSCCCMPRDACDMRMCLNKSCWQA